MGRSQESWSKKEKEKKKKKKREDKMKRKVERKEVADENTKSGPEILYVDKFGNFSAEPPVYDEEDEIEAEDIVVGIPKKEESDEDDKFTKTGKVTFFNDAKGFGFIREEKTGDSIFVHINDVIDEIKENSKVKFEVKPGQKGPMAIKVVLAG